MCKRTDDRRKSQENKLIVGYCVHIIPQKTDCNIRLIYVCLQARAPQITLHCSPASCLNISLFSLFTGNHFYIYSICIVKADSRLVVYRFILFYFMLYICIHVAPWSSVARHLVPLYVHRCSGMTIKLNLNLNLKNSFQLSSYSPPLYQLNYSMEKEFELDTLLIICLLGFI